MSNIDKRPYRADGGDISTGRLREIADNPYGDEEKCWLAKRVLALLDELEAAEKRNAELVHNHRVHAARLIDERSQLKQRIAELEAREKSLRTVGVMSKKAFQRLEGRESRFIALWPRPEIYLPRKRPADGVIVYARVAGAAKGE